MVYNDIILQDNKFIVKKGKLMRKKLFSLLLVAIMLVINVSTVPAQAKVNKPNWVTKMEKEDQPLIDTLKEYPNAELIQTKVSYVLDIAIKDENGNIIQTGKKSFSDIASMNAYEKKLNETNVDSIKIQDINPGSGKTLNFSAMQVSLALYKLTSTKYSIHSSFQSLSAPIVNWIGQCMGAVGLAVDSNLSVDGSSYEGHFSYTNAGGTFTPSISVLPRGSGAIGYSFNVFCPAGLQSISGYLNFKASKSNTGTLSSGVIAEVDLVSATASLDNFSVSAPAGISFQLATSNDRYPLQDALLLN
jgi:hypothetical protein